MAVTGIEIFGVFSSITRKISLVRIYALLSAFTTVAVLAGGLVRVVIHFTKKNELISQCTNDAKENGFAVYPFGFWGPVRTDRFDDDDASRWCNDSWDHNSWSEIVSMIFTTLIAGFWTLITPSSVANTTRIIAVGQSYPNHYNPPYGYGYNMPYAGGPPPGGQWQPPPGAPPSGPWQPPAGNQFAPPSGPPPEWEGGYTQSKDTKADNPFEDFTEIPEHERKDKTKP
ncbi:hypothetical protein DL96DRAFT_1605524 [Flagelloscypha sp. PMI_526]|nr:hypothetical protein DL96DRAFT_1605524 [Flagelloscypha sp. PMI_526]